ncbi:SET domain-containing protein-lysine N-methyltransferase [Candidatus Woesearchaeota archaeon]|nr:SET domain-containing protein-lysine N-methyltransferase [Candidatus Woesearchaeota archaeon]
MKPEESTLIVRKTTYGAGDGIFAQAQFNPYQELFVFAENIQPWKKATHRSIHLAKDRWLTPSKEEWGWYLNHSCTPNAAFKLPNKIIALNQIQKNEEITIDYSTVVHTPKWDMECLCNSKDCRKVIRSFPSMPPEFQEKYKEFNSWEN